MLIVTIILRFESFVNIFLKKYFEQKRNGLTFFDPNSAWETVCSVHSAF